MDLKLQGYFQVFLEFCQYCQYVYTHRTHFSNCNFELQVFPAIGPWHYAGHNIARTGSPGVPNYCPKWENCETHYLPLRNQQQRIIYNMANNCVFFHKIHCLSSAGRPHVERRNPRRAFPASFSISTLRWWLSQIYPWVLKLKWNTKIWKKYVWVAF